jgi:hypothetical protein
MLVALLVAATGPIAAASSRTESHGEDGRGNPRHHRDMPRCCCIRPYVCRAENTAAASLSVMTIHLGAVALGQPRVALGRRPS